MQNSRLIDRARLWALLAVTTSSLAACAADNSMTRSFGQSPESGDNRRVAALPPLSLPPEYTLRPDRPGVVRPLSAPAEVGGGRPTGARGSAGQDALLEASGPAAPADIRNRVNEDARLESVGQGFTDELMTWQRPADQPPVIQRGSSGSGSFLSRLF